MVQVQQHLLTRQGDEMMRLSRVEEEEVKPREGNEKKGKERDGQVNGTRTYSIVCSSTSLLWVAGRIYMSDEFGVFVHR